MALDDDYACPHHADSIVVLFCNTCEELVCAKCVSHGAAGTHGLHKDHVYLDVQEAFNMKKEEFEKLLAKFRDQLNSKKRRRQHLQSLIQCQKLEVLRRKTLVERRTRCLRETLLKKEKSLCKQLEDVMAPSLDTHAGKYRDLDYEIDTQDGLVESAESLIKMHSAKSVAFLKGAKGLKLSIESGIEAKSHEEKTSHVPLTHSLSRKVAAKHPELLKLSHLVSNFHRERRSFRHSFTLAIEAPSTPHVLPDWCTVGPTSASIVWKYKKSEKISGFSLYYRSTGYQSDDEDEFTRIKVNKFSGGRTMALIRKLHTDSVIKLHLVSSNEFGHSKPLCFFVQTPGDSSTSAGIFFNQPTMKPKWLKTVKDAAKFGAYVLVVLYVMVTFLIIAFRSFECEEQPFSISSAYLSFLNSMHGGRSHPRHTCLLPTHLFRTHQDEHPMKEWANEWLAYIRGPR